MRAKSSGSRQGNRVRPGRLTLNKGERFREGRTPVYIRTVLYVERESQKRILIGSAGQRIRDIGRAARAKVEQLVGEPVYLDLWVKVLPNWRKSDSALRRFGYRLHDDPSS